MPIQDYVHVRFCGVFTALNDDKAFAIRGEGIVGTGGLIPDLPLVEHVRFPVRAQFFRAKLSHPSSEIEMSSFSRSGSCLRDFSTMPRRPSVAAVGGINRFGQNY